MSLDFYLSLPPCPTCGHAEWLFEKNITHNLSKMATELGCKGVWKPIENNIYKAGDLIKPLSKSIKEMKNNPDVYRQFEPSNGFGALEDLLAFFEEILEKAHLHPEATIYASG